MLKIVVEKEFGLTDLSGELVGDLHGLVVDKRDWLVVAHDILRDAVLGDLATCVGGFHRFGFALKRHHFVVGRTRGQVAYIRQWLHQSQLANAGLLGDSWTTGLADFEHPSLSARLQLLWGQLRSRCLRCG